MRTTIWGASALAMLGLMGIAQAKDPKVQPAGKDVPTFVWEKDRDGFKSLRSQVKSLRAGVIDARRAGDDKAEALALCRLADVFSRINDRTEAAEMLLRASLLARRLEDADLGNKVTRQIRDIW